MTLSIDALTEKEKDALRLLLRGHDAKSSAQALGLSVHTVNERLREARRKLGTTSSREAARRLLAEELRVTSQRVNLFEKVKIPEAKENIRVINIFLSDQQISGVARSKLAKGKSQARIAEEEGVAV